MQEGGGEKLAREMNVPFVGKIPMNRDIAVSLDTGEPFVEKHADSEATKVINKAVDMIEAACGYK
jgi:ATP-binding protein involved in chromosome partitioning